MVATGVLAVRPGSAMTAWARLTHWSQMYPCDPPISTLTCGLVLAQNDLDSRFPESGTHSMSVCRRIGVLTAQSLLNGKPLPVATPVIGEIRGYLRRGRCVAIERPKNR